MLYKIKSLIVYHIKQTELRSHSHSHVQIGWLLLILRISFERKQNLKCRSQREFLVGEEDVRGGVRDSRSCVYGGGAVLVIYKENRRSRSKLRTHDFGVQKEYEKVSFDGEALFITLLF